MELRDGGDMVTKAHKGLRKLWNLAESSEAEEARKLEDSKRGRGENVLLTRGLPTG